MLLSDSQVARAARTTHALALLFASATALIALVVPCDGPLKSILRDGFVAGVLLFALRRLWIVNTLTRTITGDPSVERACAASDTSAAMQSGTEAERAPHVAP